MSTLRSTRIKFIVISLFCLVLYNEWISFYLKVNSWPKSLLQQNEDTLRILLVADPQILSVQTEPSFPFSYVAVWDANRFVSRSFQMTVHYGQPDIVIFLGDLLNDGSVSDNLQFAGHVDKFRKLFPSLNVKEVFYLPGDNDIGGEGFDLISKSKVQRFYTAFNSSNPLTHKFVQLYHLLYLELGKQYSDSALKSSTSHSLSIPLNAIPGAKESWPAMNIDSTNFSNDTFRIILSHYPLTSGASKNNLDVIKKIKPSVIFSAHDHISYQLVSKKNNPKASQFTTFQSNDILEINLKNEELYEISVPTCSYRMGKGDYGYGLALLSKSGILQYAVLWLPSRFAHVWSYFWGIVIFVSLLIYPFISLIALKYTINNTSITALTATAKPHRV